MKRASVGVGIGRLIAIEKGFLVISRDYYIKTDAAGKHYQSLEENCAGEKAL